MHRDHVIAREGLAVTTDMAKIEPSSSLTHRKLTWSVCPDLVPSSYHSSSIDVAD